MRMPPGFDLNLRPRTSYAVAATAHIFSALTVCILVAPWLAERVSPLALIALSPILGVYIYKLTIVTHDCAHGTLFASLRTNRLVGMMAGALLGTKFTTFAENHWAHHRNFGVAGDPQSQDYLGLKESNRSAILLHLLRPLWAYNLFKLVQLNAGIRNEKQASRSSRRWEWRATIGQLLLILIFQAVIAAAISDKGRLWWMVFFYPGCAATWGLFYSQLRGFSEHIAPTDRSEEGHIRTHLPNAFDRFFFFALNFNYHVEHHLHPQIPSCHLPKLYDALRGTIHDTESLSTSVWQTVRRRLRQADRRTRELAAAPTS